MSPPDDPCTWCTQPLPEPKDQREAAWGDLWLRYSLLWGPRPQHDFNGALCPDCGKLLVRYAVDPIWRAMIQEALRLAEAHGFDPVATYQHLLAEYEARG